ncbi:hypothetical protein [Thermomonas hydrothermalis]|uniref:hypothetical protein n=1 Tax=Thermomonas hydrothermalis TaxID=213588 RepID=UPI00093308AC|nr:hypothetical protein [Thermomonas hydrothermalis]MCL6619987.1 hypothetical protein [Thermomonas hydrothermalis]
MGSTSAQPCPLRALFNEELGAVVQVPLAERAACPDLVARHGLVECVQRIAVPLTTPVIRIADGDPELCPVVMGEGRRVAAGFIHPG